MKFLLLWIILCALVCGQNSTQPKLDNLSDAQRKQIRSYLDKALKNYEQILADKDHPQRASKVTEAPGSASQSNSAADKRQQQMLYFFDQALKNYQDILQQSTLPKSDAKVATAPPTVKEQSQQQINDYLAEALRNYDDILQKQQDKTTSAIAPKKLSTDDYLAKDRKKLLRFFAIALRNRDIGNREQLLQFLGEALAKYENILLANKSQNMHNGNVLVQQARKRLLFFLEQVLKDYENLLQLQKK